MTGASRHRRVTNEKLSMTDDFVYLLFFLLRIFRSVIALRKSRSQSTVPLAAVLQRAHLCVIIHMYEAEAHAIALCPFEIIHQAPGEITAHRVTVADEIGDDAEMFGIIIEPRLVIHLPVFDADIIAGAVFGNVALRQVVTFVECLHQRLEQPAHKPPSRYRSSHR